VVHGAECECSRRISAFDMRRGNRGGCRATGKWAIAFLSSFGAGAFSSCQLIEQRLSLLQIARVMAFCEPTVDRSEKLASLLPLPLIAPEPRHAHCRAQLE
jgi:hypothetical protein